MWLMGWWDNTFWKSSRVARFTAIKYPESTTCPDVNARQSNLTIIVLVSSLQLLSDTFSTVYLRRDSQFIPDLSELWNLRDRNNCEIGRQLGMIFHTHLDAALALESFPVVYMTRFPKLKSIWSEKWRTSVDHGKDFWWRSRNTGNDTSCGEYPVTILLKKTQN